MSEKKITYKPGGSKKPVTIYGDADSKPYKPKTPRRTGKADRRQKEVNNTRYPTR